MKLINLIDRPIAFQRSFVRLGVGIGGALMLSQAVYWAVRTKNAEGWFYKDQREWEEETGLTRREQERARKALTAIGVLEEKRRGIPARLYYRVNDQVLAEALLGEVKKASLEDVLSLHGSQVRGLAKTDYMRAIKLGASAAYVDYAEILKAAGMVCGSCREAIEYGPGRHSEALAFDYATSIQEGGTHQADNIRPAHFGCTAGGDIEAISLSNLDNQGCLGVDSKGSLKVDNHGGLEVDKQDGLGQADLPDYASQSITENTAETTAESTAKHIDRTRFDQAFEIFWSAGLVKVGKKPSVALFRSLVKGQKDPVEFATRLAEDIRQRLANKQIGFDRLHPKTYLNQARWNDDLIDDRHRHQAGDSSPQVDLNGKDYATGATGDDEIPAFLRS